VKRHVFHAEAAEEYAEAAEYYAAVDPQIAGRFYTEIQQLIANVCRSPERYPMFASPIQRHFSTVFPYAIIFRDRGDDVLIIAVMHMKRRPGYWRHRLA
jgi:toxin ParE1/3/4